MNQMSINLPTEFTSYTAGIMGDERWLRFLAAFDAVTPVSVRLNPFKVADSETILSRLGAESRVGWCRNAWYLAERPDFTHDPLLHAGAYYVQEASSMFLDNVLERLSSMQEFHGPVLDLCAAPGGKSTLLRAALSYDGDRGVKAQAPLLYSNEPDRRRANILMENLQKQGHPDVIVTSNYARDYRKAKHSFDLILCDVPCSGEGMFRKDKGAIEEWSLQNVMKCAELQRSIIEDIWPCLADDGILIYSTCTFNLHENEENVKWICETLGAELIAVPTQEDWNITGSLLEGWDEPVYRFIPGTTRGEGLFMAVLRKKAGETFKSSQQVGKGLYVLSDGHPVGTQKGKNVIPAHAEALLYNLPKEKYPRAELSIDEALRYLHHEAIVLSPEVPRGIVLVTYEGYPLGFVKNIGNRANNLYPQEWKIRQL